MSPRWQFACGAACLAGCVALHRVMESTMWSHMLLQLPLLVASGWMLGRGSVGYADLHWMCWLGRRDIQGLTCSTTLLIVTAYWMVPRALEEALSDPGVEVMKFLSLCTCGFLLVCADQRASSITQVFFLGNFCAMTAIAGLLYQEEPSQLCNAYVVDDQAVTGIGLVMLSLVTAVVWTARRCRRTDADHEHSFFQCDSTTCRKS